MQADSSQHKKFGQPVVSDALLTPPQAAVRYQIPEYLLRKACTEGRLEHLRVVNAFWLPPSAVAAFARSWRAQDRMRHRIDECLYELGVGSPAGANDAAVSYNRAMRTDRELLEKARAGDSGAVDELLARHERQVFRFGLRMCGNEEDARDVLQETLLAAFKNLRDFRGDAQVSTWLYQIARSYCLKSRRRGVAEPEQKEPLEKPEAAAVPSAEAQPDAQAHAREIGTLLQAAILSLPESHREVLILRDVEGLSADEAAHVVGIDVGALKSRLHRARMELRERLALFFGGGNEVGAAAPCPELAEELAAYAAEEIDQATCARIEEHLKRCTRCAGACATLQRTVSLCRQIPGGEVPAPVRAAVRAALLGPRSEP